MKQTITIVVAGSLLLSASCGSGEAEESPAGAAMPEAAELARLAQEDPAAARAVVMASTKTPVELPSRRRLQAFLPAEFPGYTHARLSSDLEPPAGRAFARGNYQKSASDYQNGVELEIRYAGKPTFNPQEQLFQAGFGKREEVAGFEAVVDEDETLGQPHVALYVRVAPELWVEASGQVPLATVRSAAQAVDLAGLARALDERSLFEEAPEDVLERTILSGGDLEALLPVAIGGIERSRTSGYEFFDNAPLHSRATASYASGSLTLYDYGDVEVAQAMELSASGLQGFAMYAGQATVEDEDLEVSDGRGRCALLLGDRNRSSVVALHVSRGRFVAEYIGRFVPEPEIDASLPAEMRKELERANEQMGAGAFESIEAQRDAVLAALEGLALNATH